ncbi:hypothetical protein H312_02751 [Anncaliia algerae PRA339]|uniref:B3/B4 tRNA-binding domain-containing protein n=1 Tax=Anncaliia algerae PRA339 TaxID=1288291 RepID=A0A059EXR4_9MICR|nr:hypothetical protein H312_02751 [Anncaliia algerae PRA339]
MLNCTFEIDEEICKALPEISVFLGVIENIDVEKIDTDGIENFLEEAWELARGNISQYSNVQSHPNIQLWRKAFQSLKIPTKKYTSSVESLSKRVAKENSSPFFINPLVDFYNALSLKYLIPFGGFDLNTDIGKSMVLRFSKESDTFFALDAKAPINLPPGEPLYASGNICTTRFINYKQSREGLIESTTTNICLVAEVLNGYPLEQLNAMQYEFKRLCLEFLHVEASIFIVNENNPILSF